MGGCEAACWIEEEGGCSFLGCGVWGEGEIHTPAIWIHAIFLQKTISIILHSYGFAIKMSVL